MAFSYINGDFYKLFGISISGPEWGSKGLTPGPRLFGLPNIVVGYWFRHSCNGTAEIYRGIAPCDPKPHRNDKNQTVRRNPRNMLGKSVLNETIMNVEIMNDWIFMSLT